MRGGSAQHGQTLPIFALVSLLIIGTVALSVDFGFLSNQHRNLQAFADEAATAAAYKLGPNPGPAERTAARKTALIYLRDNLNLSGVNIASVMAGCSTDFASNVGNAGTPSCQLGTSTYKVSIWSPAESVPSGQELGLTRTVSVRVIETVTTALAGAFSANTIPVGAYSVAQYGIGQPTYALYSDGCVNVTSNKLEVMAGDMYVNECTLNPGANGAFCTYGVPVSNPPAPRTQAASGHATYGPYANLPTTALSLQTPLGCTTSAGSAGKELATGNIVKAGAEDAPPAYEPPPGIPVSATPGAAPRGPCTPEHRAVGGVVPSNCYSPGAYTTVGLDGSGGIANNLNPGVYHIYGEPSAPCYTSKTELNCTAVLFGDSTLNANWNDVSHTCWKAPANIPSSGSFTAPCPDGFIDDPGGISDPQCPACPLVPLSTPVFTIGPPLLVGGNLDPTGTGTNYCVRVTAVNGFGETTTGAPPTGNEKCQVVTSVTNSGSFTVTISPAVSGATGYKLYVGTAAGAEKLDTVDTFAGLTATVTTNGTGGTFPLVDTTACPGFCNIPTGPETNYGITFVLENKAGVCVGVVDASGRCDPSQDLNTHPAIMLSPYCGSAAAGTPWTVAGGSQVCTNNSVAANDGAFVFYGPTESTIRISGIGTGIVFDVAGIIDTPKALLDLDEARFHAIPGQVIVRGVNIDSVNALDPLVYFGVSPPPPIQVRLIQ